MGEFGNAPNQFWWTLRGRPFFSSGIGISIFGWHAEYLWVQLLPFFWLFPGVGVLLFMQTFFLGVTAVPMYLIARKILDNHWAALVLAATFIMLPPIVAQNVNQISAPTLLLVYLLFTFYFFMEKRFGLFMLFAFISCLGRENVPLAIGMFGIYALLQRRDKKWVITPLALGVSYFLLVMFVVMPHFREGYQWHVTGRMFEYLGHTRREIVANAATHPGLVIGHLLEQQNVTFFTSLVQPLAWILPFLSGAWLIALPELGLIMMSDNSALKVIAWGYLGITGTFLFVSALYGIKKLCGWLEIRYGKQPYACTIAVCLLLLSFSHWYLWLFPQQYQKLPQHDTLMRALDAVPPSKSVLVPNRLQSRAWEREHYQNISTIVERPAYAVQYEYVILDANERQLPPIITQEFFDRFQKNPNYRLIFAENNVFVFQRLGGESDWKIPPLEKASTSD